jgi:hypothetical protein
MAFPLFCLSISRFIFEGFAGSARFDTTCKIIDNYFTLSGYLKLFAPRIEGIDRSIINFELILFIVNELY